jgi:hypothetical protein
MDYSQTAPKRRMFIASLMVAASVQVSSGYVVPGMSQARQVTTVLTMSAENNDNLLENEQPTSRRKMMRNTMALFGATAMAAPRSAEATYSAYAAREKDWEERLGNGEVKVTSARQLRKQLIDIAPMNNEGQMMFCPNGLSSAVSPMMENKCGERLAMPSVYGRTQDIVGNSIPGFDGGKYPGQIPGGVGTLNAASAGGFPSYGSLKETGKANMRVIE